MIVELDLLKFTYLTGLYMVFNGHYYMIARVVFLLIDQFFFRFWYAPCQKWKTYADWMTYIDFKTGMPYTWSSADS